VLGICSVDDEAVGFDTSIFWENDKRYLRTFDQNEEVIQYTLSKRPALFYRRTIRGRGTICWRAKDKENRAIIIKDAWRSKDRNPEWELLKDVKGLEGVGQMVGWEERGLTTAKLRRFDEEMLSIFLDFRDRMFCRITMEAYGGTIDHFKSREELLYAFRDAVAGHQNLWTKGILHRDISVNNVLIGKPGAEVGNRGVVIDLDMAIRLERTESLASVDFRTGTRAFQSISVLSSVNDTTGQALPHDHLDDLESFFYVLCWITLGYACPNEPILDTSRPRVLWKWDQDDASAAADSKGMIMFLGVFSEKVTPYFGFSFQKLLVALHRFLRSHILRKMEQRHDPTISRKHLLELFKPAQADYAAVLDIIDQAILDLKSETLNAQYTTPTPVTPRRIAQLLDFPVTPILSHSRSDSSLKREAEEPDMIDESPKSKKQKQQAYEKENAWEFESPVFKRTAKKGSGRSGR
jgi:serine/threonine protein kinase